MSSNFLERLPMAHQLINHTYNTLANVFFWHLQFVVMFINFELWQDGVDEFTGLELLLTSIEKEFNPGKREIHDDGDICLSETE